LKILIHGINYAPEQIGIGKYTGDMAAWLAQQGHIVRVVTAPPYYPDWRVQRPYKAWEYRRERINGVNVFRCPLWVPRSPSGLTRVIHLASFAFFSFPVMLWHVWWRPDVVLAIEPPFFCAPQAWLTARLSGAKAWLHIQDFEVTAFFGLGFSSASALKRMVVALEAWMMRRFDRVSSISKSMTERLARLRVPGEKVFLFPNWVDTDHICPDSKGRNFRVEWDLAGSRKIALYAGNMGNKQGLETVLDAAEKMAVTHPEVIFLLVGEGAAKSGLEEQARNRGLRNVLFKPLQPLAGLPSLLAMADLHLVVQKRGAADAVMPSKLTGILSVGGQALITADPETELGRLVLDNPGMAFLVEPENASALAEAIARVLASSKNTNGINRVARAYAEKYLGIKAVLNNFEQELLKLANNARL
jgi:colanic acid biosynthesis glycosyl transferase WcaI